MYISACPVDYCKHGKFRHVPIFADGTFDKIVTHENLGLMNKKHVEVLSVFFIDENGHIEFSTDKILSDENFHVYGTSVTMANFKVYV